MTAISALGRLRSHPRLETGLRTRFHDSPTDAQRQRTDGAAVAGNPTQGPACRTALSPTNEPTYQALQRPSLLFTKTQIQFRNFLSPGPEPSSGRRITPNPHRSAALTIKSRSDAHFHSPISIFSAGYENASRAPIRKYNRRQKRGRAGSLRRLQRTGYPSRLRRWPVAGAFQGAPTGVNPVAAPNGAVHQDDVEQHHRAGHQTRQRMPAATMFQNDRNLFLHQGVNGRLDQFPCLSVALRTKDFVRIGRNARFRGLFYFFPPPRRRTQERIRTVRRTHRSNQPQFFTRHPCCIGLNGTR